MSLRSPLGQALGLGAAKDGVSHWLLQRLTAVGLVPLALWFAWSLLAFDTLAYANVKGWLALPFNALGVVLLMTVLTVHSHLGVRVVIEDYVHHGGLKTLSLVLLGFAHVLIGAAGVFAVLRITLGAEA